MNEERFPSSVRRIEEHAIDTRRAIALILLFSVCAMGVWLATRDFRWEQRAEEAKLRGTTARQNGAFKTASIHYQEVLANNPHDWEAHLALASLYDHRLDKPGEALKHYLYALAYSPEPSIAGEARSSVDIIRLRMAGDLENPADALDDMFMSVESGSRDLFRHRLGDSLRPDIDAFWNAWNARGRGSIIYSRIAVLGDNLYDAYIEISYQDGSEMSMHFVCVENDVWRLYASFP